MQETAPLNLDGLQSLCSALTTAALQEVDDPLSVTEYLKVVIPGLSVMLNNPFPWHKPARKSC